ncbi:MAG: isoprenyl transferase [Aurantimonas coralicida]|uniref:Isoprenyl transferase n=1 Tax=Aurantimonas manganoxydans (strain ATCC BAA-1229 / DSM 21871 / SI85-9A1) TaxID=287752 RepID=Q1YI43_AURMS|nr:MULTISPECIES: isoprenyl transferase [Aurantimonas]EAS50274.1 undecaprenyl pyrophosphate synthetase [Aurantimonas manganoxydans SI85-9A1]MCW7545060.1 isoprenyl transferase [Aurantimonas litoralis]MDE0924950.1 isoprenyl transferase [Aurantimonas coralicida]
MRDLQHVAIIMDGNGRWANARGLPRSMGHRRGVEAVREAVRAAGELGIQYLTLFAFSSENWRRPEAEVEELMGLLKHFIRRDLAELHKEGVRVRVIGERENLSSDIRALLEEAENLTRDNQRQTLVVAFNYGARDEVARAMRRVAAKYAAGEVELEGLTAEYLDEHLDTAGIPDPDLIIRTSGELRLSNFLLWQAAYSEFVFLPCLWPDFDRKAFEEAIADYFSRDRRYGGLSREIAS